MPSLREWRHCPRCASPLAHEESRVECAGCGFVHYAASVPTASAFVVDDRGRVLLARRAVDPDRGLWDAPGGFLEEGEDPVAGLRRELAEETGTVVAVGDFVGAFVDRYGGEDDGVSVLNLVWEARITAGEPEPADDVAELCWFERDRLPDEDELAFTWLGAALRRWAHAGWPQP